MKLNVNLPGHGYPIYIERGSLTAAGQRIPVHRHTCIVTDDGIPAKWVNTVKDALPGSFVVTIPHGEGSKNLATMQQVLEQMAEAGMTRKDAVVAVGGGVCGDLAGFCAAVYMRGIDFYNIPTTVLSQVDSSVGGKTAVDLGSLKNIIGAFWQPKAVIIDPDVLSTLDDRQIAAGLAEALKMGLILDPGLVDLFEQDPLPVDEIIARSVDLKRMIVEEDEKEQGRRALLNFGHTVGHAMEGAWGLDAWLHGECVAAGMDFMLEDDTLRARVAGLKQKLGLPEIPVPETDVLMDYIRHDKKTGDAHITIVTVAEAGNGQLSRVPFDEVRRRIEARKQAAAGEHTEAAHE
ncbi:3-dehydroquinate synthase [Faecalibaculum rodentium]|jgi:3-dehydroquinate synthase|uniref:3-dehydroquinate synthase n=1 Tax=Faecalibaculum rodentium TaxID=1702221 RepID=A0A1Q9YL91_9FIRM|nr:3-dehydroquinate synthase [Faecalibaculum rodentium]OLU45649.1 3-dehydroquinate synthase [Faecalibaculum rodentium]